MVIAFLYSFDRKTKLTFFGYGLLLFSYIIIQIYNMYVDGVRNTEVGVYMLQCDCKWMHVSTSLSNIAIACLQKGLHYKG
jgi:hypothetical protein